YAFFEGGKKIKVYMLSQPVGLDKSLAPQVIEDLSEQLKASAQNFSEALKGWVPLKHQSRFLKALITSFAKPLLSQKNTPVLLTRYLKRYLYAKNKPELSIVEEKNGRVT